MGIDACAKAGQWTQALLLLSQLQRCTSGSGRWLGSCGATFTVVAGHNAAISACERSTRWEWALAMLGSFLARGADLPAHANADAVDIISFNAAAAACFKGSQWARAVALLLSEVQRYSLEPNTVSYNTAMGA